MEPGMSKPAYLSDEARWQAVANRDAAADGCFVYGVKTTRIYCKPSSPSRLPKRENVEFFRHPGIGRSRRLPAQPADARQKYGRR